MNGDGPICLWCGRGQDSAMPPILPANLLAQPGVWSCAAHQRADGWQNWPHTKPPFDLGYPSAPTID